MSRIRQNFHEEVENAINEQINMELFAMYTYHAMAVHFDRDDVAHKNFAEFYKKSSDEERDHANKFMLYINSRGGRVTLKDIKAPSKLQWTCEESLVDALQLEKDVNQVCPDIIF